MPSTCVLIILSLAVLAIYARWIIIILYLPLHYANALAIRHSFPFPLKMLMKGPYVLISRITRGGLERFVIIQVGSIPSVSVRKCIYRALGVRMGKNTVFHYKTEIRNPFKLVVDDGSIVGDNALLDARNGLVIGKNVSISSNVSIYTLQHDHRDPWFGPDKRRPMKVTIGDRAWLGCNVIVLPGVKIGEGAVCCAGCVVTKDVAPYDVVAGIPAKKVAERPRCLTYEFDGKTCWFY